MEPDSCSRSPWPVDSEPPSGNLNPQRVPSETGDAGGRGNLASSRTKSMNRHQAFCAVALLCLSAFAVAAQDPTAPADAAARAAEARNRSDAEQAKKAAEWVAALHL